MLLHLLSMAIESRETSGEYDPYVEARSKSWTKIIRLKNNPKEAQELADALTLVCGTLPLINAADWKKKLNAMHQNFHFDGHTVCYQQPVKGGMLLLAESIMRPTSAGKTGKGTIQRILNAAFFLSENSTTRKLEIRCIPAIQEDQKITVTTFAEGLLEKFLRSEMTLDVETHTAQKSWWRKLLGN